MKVLLHGEETVFPRIPWKNMAFSLIFVPIQSGTPGLLPLYSRSIFDYRQQNPLQYHILPDSLLLGSSGPGMKKNE